MPMPPKLKIRDVWKENLEEEMAIICNIIQKYNYIGMDTEFPGVVARPIGQFSSPADYQFQTLRCNVDLLKLIQLGLTFSDEKGNYPPADVCTWQFNFKFNLQEDMYAQDSIELLTRSGIDFNKFEEHGIDVDTFGELLMTSGVVLNPKVRWLTFHAGFDFAYLMKVLTAQTLPSTEIEWFELLRLYFPGIYDLKFIMKSCGNLKGGLNDLADDLKVERVGPQHQAGSDSLLTSATFFELRRQYFNDVMEDRFLGILFGLGVSSIDAGGQNLSIHSINNGNSGNGNGNGNGNAITTNSQPNSQSQ